MKKLVAFGAVVGISAGQVMAQPVERREVAEHVHGESAVQIAVDGNQMLIDFDAPGMDVVGFEYAPTRPADQAAVDSAIAALKAPFPALFDFGPAAGCAVTKADVEFMSEEREPAPPAAGGAAPAEAEATGHAGFEAVYEVTCANAAAIREVAVGFFAVFPNAQVIEISIATAKGQSTFDVERANPVASLAGLF